MEKKHRTGWIWKSPNVPYFTDESGKIWHPIGQNDALTWVDLRGIIKRADMDSAERYLQYLHAHGVNCLRLMLDYGDEFAIWFEKPVGKFNPVAVQAWDDLIELCDKYDIKLLITPLDTFWMWHRWEHHPYNQHNGGPCPDRSLMLIDKSTRQALINRMLFAVRRWGGSHTIMGWDLWNEIHPCYGCDQVSSFYDFIEEMGKSVAKLELELYGRKHLQTVSVFGPLLDPDLDEAQARFIATRVEFVPEISQAIFRHPQLDFANVHMYAKDTIDDPRDTIAPAIAVAKIMTSCMLEIQDRRPIFDSEHGPIHTFKDKKRTLAAEFDDEYFRHIQWAHVAVGGAGGGMRWPNRHPHQLTPGMRQAQHSLSKFLNRIDLGQFNRRPLDEAHLSVSSSKVFACGSGDGDKALLWLVRKIGGKLPDRRLDPAAEALHVSVTLPHLPMGNYRVLMWNTARGEMIDEYECEVETTGLELKLDLVTDMTLYIQRR